MFPAGEWAVIQKRKKLQKMLDNHEETMLKESGYFFQKYPLEEDMGKGSWQKPELIVLVRGRAEERILATCKGPVGTRLNSGPDTRRGGCSSKVVTDCDTDCSVTGYS
jgi:hypothetical protein